MCRLRKIISLIIISTIILSGTVFASQTKNIRFSDVPENHWAYEAVHDLRLLGITDGWETTALV